MPNQQHFVSRAAACAIASATVVAAPARADEFVDRVNKLFADVRPDRRSDTVILPLLAKMAPAPDYLRELRVFGLFSAQDPKFAEAKSWAEGPTQKAVIDGLKKVVKDGDPKDGFVFAQPYGIDGVPVELVRAKMFTELGDPPLLGAARMLFKPALGDMQILVHVEAMRLAADGDVVGAITLLTDWLFFARQIADRPFFREQVFGYGCMAITLERIRDLAYLDSIGKRALGAHAGKVPELIARLDLEKGSLAVSRLKFPIGDRIAAEQVIAIGFKERGGVNAATYATTMSRLGTSDHPLRLFSEAGRWESVAGSQKGWFDISEELPRVYEDWASRWTIDPFDRRMDQPFYYNTRLDSNGYATLAAAVPDMKILFRMREILKVEAVGTRGALAVLGFYYETKGFPPQFPAVRPRFIKQLDADPFNPNRARGAEPPLEYFVPVRDQPRGPREEPRPHEVQFFRGGVNFDLRFRDDQFILYSVGSDGAKNRATRVDNSWDEKLSGADYILWPPMISMYRQYLKDSGGLK